MSETSPATAQTVVPKRRVPYWDNARFGIITLVVVGHGIQRLTYGSDNALAVYLFIYAFHMPAFALISGYFSKASPPNRRQMMKVLTDILLPYVIMEMIWTVVKLLTRGGDDVNPTQPSWTLWFLLALGIFRLILPYLALLRWPLLWAVLFSVGVGYLGNVDDTFSLSRAIGILPFFVLGWKLQGSRLVERWVSGEPRVWPVRAGALVVLAAWFWAVMVFIGLWREMGLQRWFFYDDSYAEIGGGQWWAGFVRLALIALAVLLSGAVFTLMPRRATWMTGLGQATMYVYLLHSFVLYPLRETGIIGDERSTWVWLLGMIVLSIGISMVLATALIRRIFRPLIEPKPRWLFVRLDAEPRRESRVDPTGSRRS